MTPRIALLAFAIAAAMVYGLYEVEHAVRQLDRQHEDLRAAIAREREAIRVLRAEWSYLNQPSRLQNLVARHTDLRLVAPDQNVTAEAFFAAPVEEDAGEPRMENAAAAGRPAEAAPIREAKAEVASEEPAAPIGRVAAAEAPMPALKPFIAGARVIHVRGEARHGQ